MSNKGSSVVLLQYRHLHIPPECASELIVRLCPISPCGAPTRIGRVGRCVICVRRISSRAARRSRLSHWRGCTGMRIARTYAFRCPRSTSRRPRLRSRRKHRGRCLIGKDRRCYQGHMRVHTLGVWHKEEPCRWYRSTGPVSGVSWGRLTACTAPKISG